MKYCSILFMCFTGFVCYSFIRQPAPEKTNLIIHFRAVAGKEPLVFGKTYSNGFGESYSIERFRFYICRIRFRGTAKPVNKNDYFLIDFADSARSTISLYLAPGEYNSLEFLLGVDSIRNVSGAQTGALDPAKGMFWTWNSGYVMAKLEGSSPASNQPGHAIAYHIGGYKGENNVTEKISLSFPAALATGQGSSSRLIIDADVNAWFSGPHDISIKNIPACTTPGKLAKSIAENYAGMFTVAQVINP